MSTSWKDFVKAAALISQDRKTFQLAKGQSPWHVMKEWKSLHPDSAISFSDISAANGNLPANKFRYGVSYKMPAVKQKDRTSPFKLHKGCKYISEDGTSCMLPPGGTISDVVKEHNAMFPHFKISDDHITGINGGLDPRKVVAGKAYRMPTGGFSPGFKSLLESIIREYEKRGYKFPVV